VCDQRSGERACGEEADAWEDCITDHCRENPSAGNCDGPLPEPGT